jgi:hypothetical protein
MAYIDAYGTGCLDDFIWVLNPFSANSNLNLLTRGEAALSTLRELHASGIRKVPYPIHPAAGGLLPWGITDNGNVLYWLTTGAPDGWPVVLSAVRDGRTERYPCGMATFLVKLLTGEVVSHLLPGDFPGEAPSFSPA